MVVVVVAAAKDFFRCAREARFGRADEYHESRKSSATAEMRSFFFVGIEGRPGVSPKHRVRPGITDVVTDVYVVSNSMFSDTRSAVTC